MTTEKILKGFYHITTGIMVLGTVMLILENEPDMIYSVWTAGTMVLGSYLIEKK